MLHGRTWVKRIIHGTRLSTFFWGGKNFFLLFCSIWGQKWRSRCKSACWSLQLEHSTCGGGWRGNAFHQLVHPELQPGTAVSGLSPYLCLLPPASHWKILPVQVEELSSYVTGKAEAFPLLPLRLLFYRHARKVTRTHCTSPSPPDHRAVPQQASLPSVHSLVPTTNTHTLALKACTSKWKHGHITWFGGKFCSLFLLLPLTHSVWNHFWFRYMHRHCLWHLVSPLTLPPKCRKI